MSLYEIDHAATQARLDAANTSGRRTLDECARRSAEIDKQVTQLRARQEREKRAMDEQVRNATRRRPELPKRPATLALGGEEFREVKAARGQQPPSMPPRPPAPPMPPPGGQGRPVPQAGPVSLPRSGVHIRRESQARPVHRQPPAVEEKRQVKPPANDDPPHLTRRTLMLGAPEDREPTDRKPPAADGKQPPGGRKPPVEDRKSPPRTPPAEGDDDLSGRTWLR